MHKDDHSATNYSDIAAQVRSLGRMKLADLRDVWRSQWGAPPRLRSTELLRLIVAWRIQAAAEGDLSPRTRVRLRSKAMPRTPMPPVGTRLTREYRGTLYAVEIAEDGVIYAGHAYRSLSAVVREITGTRWNGPRFFGLRGGVAS